MSNYVAPAFNPKSGLIVDASWIDNHFGAHIYGVRFVNDDKVYRSIECGMEAAADEIERLRAALKPPSIKYALEKAGINVSDNELAIICRKLGIGQQQAGDK